MLAFITKLVCFFKNRSYQSTIVKLNARRKLSVQLALPAQAQEVCLEINLGRDLALYRHYLDKNKLLDLEQQVLKNLLPE